MSKDNKAIKTKYRLKGHESFYLRDGWLRKGMRRVEEYPYLFTEDNVVDLLAVGANMVKSIRYWLYATGLVKENIKNGKREQQLTQDLGEIIYKYDPYFEEFFSLWLLHFNIVSNKELCTSWYLFFNKFPLKEFTKEELIQGMEVVMEEYLKEDSYSKKSLHDDCQTILKTYVKDVASHDPEDNLVCPLAELGLIKIQGIKQGKITYVKSKPNMEKLPALFVMYIISKLTETYEGIAIDLLIESDNNLGKLLNFDRMMAYQYLEQLKQMNLININRTSGLDMVYPKSKITAQGVLEAYYSKESRSEGK